jgi:hypothetical protein
MVRPIDLLRAIRTIINASTIKDKTICLGIDLHDHRSDSYRLPQLELALRIDGATTGNTVRSTAGCLLVAALCLACRLVLRNGNSPINHVITPGVEEAARIATVKLTVRQGTIRQLLGGDTDDNLGLLRLSSKIAEGDAEGLSNGYGPAIGAGTIRGKLVELQPLVEMLNGCFRIDVK